MPLRMGTINYALELGRFDNVRFKEPLAHGSDADTFFKKIDLDLDPVGIHVR